MKKACIEAAKCYNNNRLFDSTDPVLNKDDCLYTFQLLRKEMQARDFDLSTSDLNRPEDSEIVFFNDMPRRVPEKKPGQRFYLFAMESLGVLPEGFDLSRYSAFDKVFTWKDDIVDGRRVIKVNYAFKFPAAPAETDGADGRGLACMIANNRITGHPLGLYGERARAADWFETNHPEEFGLYGGDWDTIFPCYTLPGRILRKLRLDGLARLRRRPCLKGFASPKWPVLRKYRFNICYENMRDVPGYITEKIFDCFFAGCVPVYWGAPNVLDYIPGDCFVDRRAFGSNEELYDFLNAMPEDVWSGYLRAAGVFLNSDRKTAFTSESFVRTIMDSVFNG